MSDDEVHELTEKIEALESVRDELVNEIADRKLEIDELRKEIDALREEELENQEKIGGLVEEIERFQAAAKEAAETATAARKAELEGEVVRANRELVSAKNVTKGFRNACGKLRSALEMKELMVLDLDWEVEGLKQGILVIEERGKDLEDKIRVLEMKEFEGKSVKKRVEVELKEEIEKKEKEIGELKDKIVELKRVECGLDWMKEKRNLEEAVRESEEKVRSMELNVLELQGRVREAEDAMRLLKGKVDEAMIGMDSEVYGVKWFKLQWPVVAAASTGAIAATVVVIYVCYGRRV